MEIIKHPDPILRQICSPVTEFGELKTLIDEMTKTMIENRGVGLAAPQIGISKQIFLAVVSGKVETFINPEIIKGGMIKDTFTEGCLSLPGISKEIERYRNIKIKYLDINGKQVIKTFAGLPARIIQHEMDHLLGKLIID